MISINVQPLNGKIYQFEINKFWSIKLIKKFLITKFLNNKYNIKIKYKRIVYMSIFTNNRYYIQNNLH